MISVIGDIILDKYDYCSNRTNPESSAPCYTVEYTEYKPGGAGNVAANLSSLGSNSKIIGVVGEDPFGTMMENILDKYNITNGLIKDNERNTIVKERILSSSDGRYHYRKDIEKKIYINHLHVKEIIDSTKNSNFILVSDYNKGTISEQLMVELKKLNIPIIVDPKPNHKDFYKNVFMVKPNGNEVREMAGLSDDIDSAKKLRDELETNILLTRSEKGIFYAGLDEEFNLPTRSKKVLDVTGAGDTVVATFVHFLQKGFTIRNCVELANKAAGVAIQYPGCYQVREEEILD
ncbi:MAG: bifunctional heptose 7-phosphate kinase/heptose 1-phosphate adenyltransferase [Leptospiraceae bacterium]|nr:bifunctional heptose 7-phosphate kinase/heptose 1-phosphate adenyltransferase [Leptospiraceae bacterium]